ncbi:hypothetical protein [Polaromonas sp.]|uniref:capsular polysaccharide export protein, LipB/KpsS family n=1 Tax=Polaromonas sp. TaxID=1869339 RepID=UPI0037527982
MNKQQKILCLSRSYLSKLMPTLAQYDNDFTYLHIVQTDREEKIVKSLGGVVVLNMQKAVRDAFSHANSVLWQEPEDMRQVTGFDWSATYSDRYLVHYDESHRRIIAGALQQAVEKLFKEHRFEGFLGEPVALFVTHLIFYHCRKNGVKPLLWCNTYFSDHFYFSDQTNISVPVRRQPLDEDGIPGLTKIIKKYVDGIIADKTGPLYHHAFSGPKQNKLGYFKQRRGESPLVLRPGWSSRLIQIARLARARWYRMNFRFNGDYMTAGSVSEHQFYLSCLFARHSIYDLMPQGPIENNVVYPLQYEPEASLLYFAPHVVNQISFVESILKALPDDRILWVKEHPNQFGALSNAAWRKLKIKYGNLRFVHGRQNGRELIKRSSLIVTISSTMGMDALLLGRCLLVAGRVFFDRFSGAIQTCSYEKLARELNEPSNYRLRDNIIALTGELIEFGRHTYLGDPQPAYGLYDPQNIEKIIYAIRSELID